MATVGNERYLRHVLLLGKGGLLVLRRIVVREASKRGQTLEYILLNNKSVFQNILKEQRLVLFPCPATANADAGTWDMTLLMLVLKRLFWPSLSHAERTSISILQTNRNEIQGHPTEMSMIAHDYATYRIDVTRALQQLASGIDRQTMDDVDIVINSTDTGEIDIQSAIRMIQELHEFKMELQNLVQGGLDVTNSKISDVALQLRDIQDLTGRMHRMDITTKKQKTGKALKTIIKAKCDEKKKERQALELLFEFVELIQGTNKLTEEQIKMNIKAKIEWHGGLCMKLIDDLLIMFTDMEEIRDASPGLARFGSILIPIQCSSLTGLLEHIAYMNDYNCRKRLSAISHTVSKILNFPCSFSLTVSTEDLQAIIATMSAQSKQEESCSESKNIVLPFQTTSLSGLTQLWRMFGEGRANRHLVKLSETLSKIFDAPIGLTTLIDLDQCVEALYETEKPPHSPNEDKTEKDAAEVTEVLASQKEKPSPSLKEEKIENDATDVDVFADAKVSIIQRKHLSQQLPNLRSYSLWDTDEPIQLGGEKETVKITVIWT